MSAPFLFAVMGPTASGKSHVAEWLADRLDAVILNADAFQVYEGMDIGTAKPANRERYELLDLRTPDQDYGVGEYVVDAANVLQHLYSQGRNAIVCGGTGLYIRALFEEYQDLDAAPSPELRAELATWTLEQAVAKLLELEPGTILDLKNGVRVKRRIEKILSPSNSIKFQLPGFRTKKVAIVPDLEQTLLSVQQRTLEMFQNGWVGEVQRLLNKTYQTTDPGFRAIGYRAIARSLSEPDDQDQLIAQIVLETVQYAKRQRTWLRAEPRLDVYTDISTLKGVLASI